MKRKKPTNYLNNENLIREVMSSKEKKASNPSHTPAECLSPTLVVMLMQLVSNYSTHRYFRGYSYLEDMKADALLALCQNALKFDPAKSQNPFAYYTQIVTNRFWSHLEKEKRVRSIRDTLLEQNARTPSLNRQIENEEAQREAPAAGEVTTLKVGGEYDSREIGRLPEPGGVANGPAGKKYGAGSTGKMKSSGRQHRGG